MKEIESINDVKLGNSISFGGCADRDDGDYWDEAACTAGFIAGATFIGAGLLTTAPVIASAAGAAATVSAVSTGVGMVAGGIDTLVGIASGDINL